MTQAEVSKYILELDQSREGRRAAVATERAWANIQPESLPLPFFERLQKRHNEAAIKESIALLQRRVDITIPQSMMAETDDANLFWHAGPHHLDFSMYVPADCGMAAVLPNTLSALNYAFCWNLKQPYRHFRAGGDVGFNTTGRVGFTGTYGNETVWVMFAPNAYFGRVYDDAYAPALSRWNITGTDARLSPKRFKIWTVFLMHLLAKISYRNVVINPRTAYGTHVDVSLWELRDIWTVM